MNDNTIFKVKIIKSMCYIDSHDDYYSASLFYPVAGDWEEVTFKEKLELEDAIRYANSTVREGRYFLVEYSDDIREEVFKGAKDFLDKMEKERKKEELRKQEYARKKEEKAQERKRKQLEKLKKELGEE